MEILYVTRGIIDTIKEKEDLFEIRNFMYTNAALLSGKIAAAASAVKTRIYVIGGYHVAANGTEFFNFCPSCNTKLSPANDDVGLRGCGGNP